MRWILSKFSITDFILLVAGWCFGIAMVSAYMQDWASVILHCFFALTNLVMVVAIKVIDGDY